MPGPNETNTVVAEWVEKAENDLKAATHLLRIEGECPNEIVCFHSQQCVEKYLKALLVFENIDFSKTHDIEQILKLLPAGIDAELMAEEQRLLTSYATVMRYPGDHEPVLLSEARKAVALARRVRKGVRKTLPREALRRKKV